MRMTGPLRRRHWLSLGLAPALAVFLVLVFDFFEWSFWRQHLQSLADATVQVHASDVRRGRPIPVPGPGEWPASVDLVRIEHPPRGGLYPGQPQAVRIHVEAHHAPIISGFLVGPLKARVTATAAWMPTDLPGETRLVRLE